MATRVLAGGVEYVSATGIATGTLVSGGNATQYVLTGGIASNTSVGSGGNQIVSSGGVLSGTTTLSGGKLEVQTGGSAGASTVGFAAAVGGHLVLDDLQHFAGLIAGFGVPGDIDLVDIALGSNTSMIFTEAGSNLSGTLSVSDGVHIANLTLFGQYVTGQFKAAGDGHGGTLITDPPIATGSGIATPP